MNALVLFELLATVLLRMVIHQLVARRTQQHQITDIVDIHRPLSRATAWAFRLERDDVRHLAEDALGKRQVMPQHVLITPVQLALASRSNEKE